MSDPGPLPAPARTAAAWLLLAALAVAAWLAAVQPLLRWRAASVQEGARLDAALAQGQEAAERANARAARLEQRADDPADRGLLPGATPEQAAAAAQQILAPLLARNQARLLSVAVLPPRPAGLLTEVGLRVTFEAGMEGLAAVLEGIEAAEPFLVVHALSAERRDWAAGQGPPRINVTAAVAGFIRQAAEAAPEDPP